MSTITTRGAAAVLAALSALLTITITIQQAKADSASTTPSAPIVAPTDADKALAAQVEAAAKLDPGTPGREAMNFMMNEWPHDSLLMLEGVKPTTEAGLEYARGTVNYLAKPMEEGPIWPLPSLVHIPHASGPITVDGKVDSPGWKSAAVFHGEYLFNSKDHADNPETTWRVTWDEKYLYFAFECADTDIIAPPMDRDKDPFDYDACEMFILPEPRSPVPTYWEIVVGPQNAIYDGLHLKKLDGWGYYDSPGGPQLNVEGLQTATSIQKDPKTGADLGYTIEVAVPFDQLPSFMRGNPPRAGDTMSIMLCRMDKHEKTQDFYSVVPLLSWGHNIWNYIPVKLESSRYRAH